MPKQKAWLRRAAVAAIVTGSLLSPLYAVAQTDQQMKRPRAAPAHWRHFSVANRNLYDSARTSVDARWT